MNENQNLVASGMLHDFLVHDFVHDLEALQGFLLCHTDVLLLQSNGTETVVEVEQTLKQKQDRCN